MLKTKGMRQVDLLLASLYQLGTRPQGAALAVLPTSVPSHKTRGKTGFSLLGDTFLVPNPVKKVSPRISPTNLFAGSAMPRSYNLTWQPGVGADFTKKLNEKAAALKKRRRQLHRAIQHEMRAWAGDYLRYIVELMPEHRTAAQRY